MAQEQFQAKMINLIRTLAAQTASETTIWSHEEGDVYVTPFVDEDKIEFSFQIDEYDEESMGFLLIFMNSRKVQYGVFYSISEGSPGHNEFKALYRAIKDAEERLLLKNCDKFMSQLSGGNTNG